MDRAFDQYDEECEAILNEARRGHLFSAMDAVAANSGDGKAHLPTQYLLENGKCV